MYTFVLFLIVTLYCGCTTVPQLHPDNTRVNRTISYQQQITNLINKDAENKKWARLMLIELNNAILNDDYDAFVFYLEEYEKIPKEIVPHDFRNEPGYVQPISSLEEYFRVKRHLPAVQVIKWDIPEYTK